MEFDPILKKQVTDQPDETYNVIVRVEGDLDTRQQQLEADGLQITRRLRLIRGFAATAPGTAVQKAAAEDFIVSIERDQQVHTMDESNPQSPGGTEMSG
jgi:hypothetical protein